VIGTVQKRISVRFYKRLILTVLSFFVITPTAFTIILLVRNDRLRKEALQKTIAADDLITVGASEFTLSPKPPHQPSLEYQEKWLDFRYGFSGFESSADLSKTVFLTFDDGPSSETLSILSILRSYDVKATFFVSGKTDRRIAGLQKSIVSEGHTIGMHSFSHRYASIYRSVDSLLEDFYRNFTDIVSETGVVPSILRLPGGSINAYNMQNYQEILAEFIRRGFVYFDWNVSGGDLVKSASAQCIADTVIAGAVRHKTGSIVLLHDSGNPVTTASLPLMIESLKSLGYEFRKLDDKVVPTIFSYQD
jgi:peptidoglycan/xylan/chitin deacetylase (PgdA/CDA1 family)